MRSMVEGFLRQEGPSTAFGGPPPLQTQGRIFMIARLLILIAKGWQKGPSQILPPSCRYQPSCSAYAITAIQRYGAARGGWLALKRIFRCHPWGGQGYDPVP